MSVVSPALEWFGALEKGNPAARARLRRCRSRSSALAEPSAIQLAQRLGLLTTASRADGEAIGVAIDLARVLAHVKKHSGKKRVMQSAGWKTFAGNRKESDAGADRPVLSQLRFRRLLTAEGGEPLVAAFTRLIRQLDGEVNVTDLAYAFLWWTHESRGQQVRNNWAFDYYAAGNTASTNTETSTDPEVTL